MKFGEMEPEAPLGQRGQRITAVEFVADYRVSDSCQMNSYLMPPTSLRNHIDEG